MAIVGANNTTNITIGPISTYIPFEDWGGGVGGGGGGHGGGETSAKSKRSWLLWVKMSKHGK